MILVSSSKNSFILLVLLFSFLTGCVVEERGARRYRLPRNERDAGGYGVQIERYAWEVWPSERDLDGGSLSQPVMLRGDKLVEQGKHREALSEYQRIKSETLALAERDALVLRIASTQLSLRQAKAALATISSYFRSSGKNVDDANAYFSLVLGYGYAAVGDINQAYAWLSRAKRTAAQSATIGNAAQFGVNRLAQSFAPDEFETVAESWRADAFISGILGQERRRRSFGGAIATLGENNDGLYETIKVAIAAGVGGDNGIDGDSTVTSDGASAQAQPPSSGAIVGVILPLTGKFASLGNSVKNGIELALSSTASPATTPLIKDDGGNAQQSVAYAQDLSSVNHAAFILGPLLSEAAEAVAQVTSDASSPVISFSKKEVFSGGRGAFRLGATSSSQVRSLFNAIDTKLDLKKLAVVYPEDETGTEFARLFKEAAQQRNLALVYERSFRRSEPDALIRIAGEIEAAQPDGIFFPDNIIEATRFFTALKPALRQTMVPLGPALWDNEAQLNRSKNVLEGAVFVSPFHAASRKEIIVRFVEAYTNRYKIKPDFLAAQAFDSATIGLAALRKQLAEGISFSQAMTAIDRYEGLTGTIQVRPDGEIDRNFEVVSLTQGQIGEVQKRFNDTFVGRGDVVLGR